LFVHLALRMNGEEWRHDILFEAWPYICTQITLSKSIPSYINMECSFSNQRNKEEENAEEIDMRPNQR